MTGAAGLLGRYVGGALVALVLGAPGACGPKDPAPLPPSAAVVASENEALRTRTGRLEAQVQRLEKDVATLEKDVRQLRKELRHRQTPTIVIAPTPTPRPGEIPLAPGTPPGKTGVLRVNATPGGTVYLDRQLVGTVPIVLRVSPGQHYLKIEDPSTKRVFDKMIDIAAGKEVNLTIDLRAPREKMNPEENPR